MVAIDLESGSLEFTGAALQTACPRKSSWCRGMFSKAANPVIHVHALQQRLDPGR